MTVKPGMATPTIPREVAGTGLRTQTAYDLCFGEATTGLSGPQGVNGRTATQCSAPMT